MRRFVLGVLFVLVVMLCFWAANRKTPVARPVLAQAQSPGPRAYAGVTMPANALTDIELGLRLLQSPDPEERAQAARWIGSYGEEARPAVPYLIRMLSDPCDQGPPSLASAVGPFSPRHDALNALLSLRDVALPELLQSLKDRNKSVPYRVVHGLGNTYAARTPTDDRYDIRGSVAGILGEMKCKEAVEPLLKIIGDRGSPIRATAARALIDIGTDEAIDGAVVLLRDAERSTRSDIARHLGQTKAARAVPQLVGLLEDADSQVVSDAVYALREIGSKRAVAPLNGLLGHRDWFVRHVAAGALISLGDRSLCEIVAEELGKDESDLDERILEEVAKANDPRVIDAALSAIRAERNTKLAVVALGRSDNPRVLSVLIGLLMSGESQTFHAAVTALSTRADPGAANALCKLLDSPDAWRRDSALSALSSIPDKRAVPGLLKSLRQGNKDERGRTMTLIALADVGVGSEAQHDLIPVLKDNAPVNRWMAVALLGEAKTAESISALAGALRDSNPGVRARAAESLGVIGTKAAEDALISELMNPNSSNRPYATAALGRIRSKRAINYLNAALSDKSEVVRGKAQSVLKHPEYIRPPAMYPYPKQYGGFIGEIMFGRFSSTYGEDKRSVAQLIAALQDPDEAQRERATYLLRRKKAKQAVEPLIKVLLADQSSRVRVSAAHALHTIKDPRAVPAMVEVLKTEPKPRPQPPPAITANRATLEAVIDLLDHPDKGVARASHEAIKRMTQQDFGTDKRRWREWVEGRVAE